MLDASGILQSDPLVKLVQEENFIGWVFNIDYDVAKIMTNDLWKANVLGVPHNSFLLATSFNPKEFAKVRPEEREVILLRVVSSCKLPQDDDLVRTRIDLFKRRTAPIEVDEQQNPDDITQNELQFGGLECRVLGTFYTSGGELHLGSDLESFASAARLLVYRPRSAALGMIVNHIDPQRRKAAIEEAKELGFKAPIAPFQIGTVRYTSTARLHRRDAAEIVPVCIQPSDFLARRTAVLGMTRTGKSNMVKQTVSVVKRVANEGHINIGQIIYDINGEYANANRQDKGAISDIYPNDTIRYRMLPAEGFQVLQNNFYIQLNEGLSIIRQTIKENEGSVSGDVEVFLNTSFDEPDKREDNGKLHKRWRVRTAAYKALLHVAQYPAPAGYRVEFEANDSVRQAVTNVVGSPLNDPKNGLTLDEAVEWFTAAREANRISPLQSSSATKSKPKAWLDNDVLSLLNMMVQKNNNDTFIKGHVVLGASRKFHSERRKQEVGEEIYRHLVNGKIVILDISVGNALIRERLSQQIAKYIFDSSMETFIAGKQPPNIVVYIEEAHNLIGKGLDLTETWPRLAKEGAKYRIALVYATQEVSSVHPNILSNTENWFISHLNNEREIGELAKFYDFDDFSRSLLRAQDVGFVRMKTLSSPFVIPVQIDQFNPAKAKELAQMRPNSTESSISQDDGSKSEENRLW
jgi:hypothetical protein